MGMTESDILGYEREHWRSWARDPAYFETHFGRDGFIILDDRILDKESTLTAMKGMLPWDDFTFENVISRTYGEGVVCLLYHVTAWREGVTVTRAVSSVYVDRRNRPVLVLHQQSAAPAK